MNGVVEQLSNTPEAQFESGEARTDLLGTVGALIFTVGAWLQPEMKEGAVILAGLFGYTIWRVVRGWGVPYIRLNGERLLVFDHGSLQHYVDLRTVAAVRPGFNRTNLVLREGLTVSISHLGFMSTEESERFKQSLQARIPVTQPQAGV